MKKHILVPGARDMKTIHSAGIRSIPKSQRSMYLDLFILSQERDRMDKEHMVVSKRHRLLGKQLGSVNRRLDKLQEELVRERELKQGKLGKPLGKVRKKMKIKY